MIEDREAWRRGWEWRGEEYARRRERARAVARRRGRLRLAALITGISLVVCLVLVSRAFSLPAPYARAALAIDPDTTRGSVAVVVSPHDNTQSSSTTGVEGVADWTSGQSTVWSTVIDGAVISEADVDLTDVELLRGRITAASVNLIADAGATREADSGGVDISTIDDLRVDGAVIDVSSLPLTIIGVGTLYGLEPRTTQTDQGLEVQISGLRLHLTADWQGIPEGSDIIVGSAAACSDEVTARSLLPLPVPTATPSPSPIPGGSGGSSSGGSGGSSSSGDLDSSGGGSSDSSGSGSTQGHGAHHHHLSFPGAVFPVDGTVWYSDSSGADGGQTGCDIFARTGTPVVAVQDGTITDLKYPALGGNSFSLVNDRGDSFSYAQLLSYAAGIGNGSVVTAGQLLGYVGNTGDAAVTPPSLHFEIHPKKHAPVDPYPYLVLWQTGSAPSAGSSASPSPEPSFAQSYVSVAAEDGRHEQPVRLAREGMSPEGPGWASLILATVCVGALAGLTTASVRRRRLQFQPVPVDQGDLRRSVLLLESQKGADPT